MNLHLGSGYQYRTGWVNVDKLSYVKSDVQHDLTIAPWPWPDNSVDRAEADNLVEHIGWGPHGEDLLLVFMNEAHRVLKPGGKLWIRVPDFQRWPVGALRDPTHRRYFVVGSFDYWTADHQTYKHYGSSYGYRPWKIKIELESFGNHAFIAATQMPVKENL